MWDALTGRKQYTFEGHEAPVYSVCPHHKESIQVCVCEPSDDALTRFDLDLSDVRDDVPMDATDMQ